MKIEEKYDKKTKEMVSLVYQHSLEIHEGNWWQTYQAYLIQEEKIWDVQGGVDTLTHGSVWSAWRLWVWILLGCAKTEI